ncbi:hypothetical protein AM587_10014547 [Phytophthora nicotianae]|uniref:DDE-1 domain-containing protein n=1 Tax=Phytophthora nicotianae TaxID=4792 RepID=A0A0W8CUL7_PHYNI|nr:hypothetical protein AM587_10014547 [Phytophthora nicotianae]
MDQTAVFIDNPGKLTVDYCGTRNIDIVQGAAENTGRCSVFFYLASSVTGCRMLLLDSLKAHKMASIRETLETECMTQVQYIPPGVTALSQPMDVSVMRTFKKKIEDLYVHYHTDHPFPADTAERRVMLSFVVAKAWDMVKAKSIVKGFERQNCFL